MSKVISTSVGGDRAPKTGDSRIVERFALFPKSGATHGANGFATRTIWLQHYYSCELYQDGTTLQTRPAGWIVQVEYTAS